MYTVVTELITLDLGGITPLVTFLEACQIFIQKILKVLASLAQLNSILHVCHLKVQSMCILSGQTFFYLSFK